MLNKKDLQIVQYDTELSKLFENMARRDLHAFIEGWFKIPELRRTKNKLDCYESLDKPSMLRRMKTIDWPDGLCVYQIGQVKMAAFERLQRKHWNTIRLSNGKENINMHLDMEGIKLGLEKYLSHFFHCYIYASHHSATESYVFSMSIADKGKEKDSFMDMRFGFMIYFPETNLIITPLTVWIKEYDSHFKEALLDTFSANTLRTEPMSVPSIKTINDFAQNIKSGGIFGGLQNNEVDANPLDIRQKRQMGSDEAYVKGNEQKKRIVPIDMDDIQERYDNMKANFSWKSVTGHKRLFVKLKLPLDSGKPNHPTNYDDDEIEISMTMAGLNVAEGIKELIRYGKIEEDPPVWLKGIVISGAKKLIVSSEGVYQEVKDEVQVTKHRMF